MKNQFLFFLLFMVLCYACNTTATNDDTNRDSELAVDPDIEVDNNTEEEEMEVETTDIDVEDLYGYYVGMFEAEVYDEKKKPSWANKINISIDKIESGNVTGHSVVAGNDRPFSGTIELTDDGLFKVEAKEPGDDKYDGKFSFEIDPKENLVKGVWDANDKKLAVTQRKYKLEKRAFKYNPDFTLDAVGYTDIYDTYNEKTGESEIITGDVASKNPSKEELTKADVENMKKGDLEVMRNSIYARHGYSFKNRKMRYVFNYVDWYIPVNVDIRSSLTELEKKNIDLMKRYEQHAERYYDSFGR